MYILGDCYQNSGLSDREESNIKVYMSRVFCSSLGFRSLLRVFRGLQVHCPPNGSVITTHRCCQLGDCLARFWTSQETEGHISRAILLLLTMPSPHTAPPGRLCSTHFHGMNQDWMTWVPTLFL